MKNWYYNKVVGIEISKILGNTNTSKEVASFLLDFFEFEDISIKTRILEPAVGTGSFYFLIIDKLLIKGFTIEEIVEHILYAVDIDPEAIDFVEKELLNKYNYQLNERTRIFCQNFLLTDFTRNNETVLFDYIVTNPPYISNKNIVPDKGFSSKEEYINHLIKTIDPSIKIVSDIYIYFFLKSAKILKENGKCAFLCSDSWLETKFGKVLNKYLSKNFNLDIIVNSQLEPFFRDDTNAIFTVVTKYPEKENLSKLKLDTKIYSFRDYLKNLTKPYKYLSIKRDDINSLLESSLNNKRNPLILFPDFYGKIKNFFEVNNKSFSTFEKHFKITKTVVSQATLSKDKLITNLSNETALFWQIQARINKTTNYKNIVYRNELMYSVKDVECNQLYPKNFKSETIYLSTIIDRFPLLFFTNYPTFHVSKYFSIENKTSKTTLNDVFLINNIYSFLHMEFLLKEGTRKTLRSDEKGLAKEIRKEDLALILIPKNISFIDIEDICNSYAKKVLFNIEKIVLDKDYLDIQKHITRSMGLNENDLKFAYETSLKLYIIRMRNLNKIPILDDYVNNIINQIDFSL